MSICLVYDGDIYFAQIHLENPCKPQTETILPNPYCLDIRAVPEFSQEVNTLHGIVKTNLS